MEDDLTLKVEKLEETLKEKESHIETLNTKIASLNKNYEAIEKENKCLKQDVKKRENYLQQKLQLEIDIKKVQREKQDLNSQFEAYKNNFKLFEEKSEYVKKLEEQLQQTQNKVHELQLIQQNERKSIENKKQEKTKDIPIENKINDLQIIKLTKENQISKEVNQTLIKLLKLKTVQNQTLKVLYSEKGIPKEEAQRNLDKFHNEEKKLHKLYNFYPSYNSLK